MQTQVLHQSKAHIPWIPALVAALVVVATALSLQLAFRDRGSTVAPSIATVDQITDPGAGRMANHANDMQARGGSQGPSIEGRGPFADGTSRPVTGGDEGYEFSLPRNFGHPRG